MMKDARNPPTFTTPVAEPRLRIGLKVRAKSNPISEPGPPMAMTTTSRMTDQTGGWPGHLLAVEVHLRPVLVELGATVPARGLYVTEPELASLNAPLTKWAQSAVPLIRRALGLG